MPPLVPDDRGTFFDRAARLVKNTGTTYASSDLVFGVDDETEARLDMDYEVDLDGEGEGDDDDEGTDDSDGDEDDDVVALEKDEHRHPKRPTAQEVIDLSGILDSGIDDEDGDEDEDDEDQKRRRRARP